MREYWLDIDEALKNGLTPERNTAPNSQLLETFLGFRCGRIGAEAYIAGSNPITAPIDMHYTYPFPQFIRGETFNILVVRNPSDGLDYLYEVKDDMSTVSEIGTVISDGLFELADFGEYAIITNGSTIFYYDYDASTWVSTGALSTLPTMETICNFNQQAVGGGVTSAWYDCDEKYYVWAKIGEIDFELDQTNEAGYRRCPFGGDICHVRKLGNMVVGYSTKGVIALVPISEPTTTFGLRELNDIGIINKGAMDGNFKVQVYVGNDLTIRRVSQEGVENLNYQHHLEELGTDEDILVRFDKGRNDFYIGNSSKTFLLSPGGLSEVPQHPTAVWRMSSERPYMLPDTVGSYKPYIETTLFNMGYNGRKDIATFESDVFLGSFPYAMVEFSYDQTNWFETKFTPINNEGIVAIPASGTSFKFHLRMDNLDEKSTISYMRTRYKMADLRGIRGVYAPKPRGQI